MSNLQPNRVIGPGAVVPGVKRAYSEFRTEPLCVARLGAGAASGTAAARNEMLVAGEGLAPPLKLSWIVIGTQTVLAPNLTANGLDLTQDTAVAADGAEIFHGLTARDPLCFTVGTDPEFYLKATLKVADVSGIDPLVIGFKKVEAFQTDINDYDELAAIGIVGTAAKYQILTILNNAATVTTDTTQTGTDAAVVTFEVRVSSAGVVTFWIDGLAPTVTKVFSFDSGEVVMPFLRHIQAADLSGTMELSLWDCGHR